MLARFFSRRREYGFTLAEVMVVVAIIAVLVAIAVPSFLSQRKVANESALKADLMNAAQAIEESKVDNGGRYPRPASLPTAAKSSTVEGAVLKYSVSPDRFDYCVHIASNGLNFYKNSAQTEASTVDCTYPITGVSASPKLTGRMNGNRPALSWTTISGSTSYIIYKNNVAVQTVTAQNLLSTQSVTLAAMPASQTAEFTVAANNSARSNRIRLTAPTPLPTTPTITLNGEQVVDATRINYSIGWSGIKYATGYQVYDVTGASPLLLATLPPTASKYTVSATRGTPKNIAVRSVNSTGTSPQSNVLTLNTAWPTARILSASSDATNGKISLTFATEKLGAYTPDYGWPNARVRVKIVNAINGITAYDQSGISTITHTTPGSFPRVNHRVTIIVTTATGQTLAESAPVTVSFPPPAAPAAVKDLTSNNSGTALISPNRLEWSRVVCSSSTPEYMVTHSGQSSTWFNATDWDIPQSWLTQGTQETFSVVARCKNGNGVSTSSPATSTTFTTGLAAPEIPGGLASVDRSRIISWSGASCSTGTSPQYSVYQTVRNGQSVDTIYGAIDNQTTFTLPVLNPGSKQTVSLAARCVKKDGAGSVTGVSSWSPYSDEVTWYAYNTAPTAPMLNYDAHSNTATLTEYTLAWSSTPNTTKYVVYNSATGAAIKTFSATQNRGTITTPRNTITTVYIKAHNDDYASPASNIVELTDR